MSAKDPSPGLRGARLRVARPTDALEAVVAFYRDGLGFELLGGFDDHEGFDGAMLGHPGAPYHLEFTHERGCTVGRAPTPEHLLVFYLPEEDAWRSAIAQLEALGHAPVPAANPYWDRAGVTFEDPDGYRIVLQRAPWPPR